MGFVQAVVSPALTPLLTLPLAPPAPHHAGAASDYQTPSDPSEQFLAFHLQPPPPERGGAEEGSGPADLRRYVVVGLNTNICPSENSAN